MKLSQIAAAALLVATIGLDTAAIAQERVVTRTTTTTVHRESGWRAGPRRRKVCTVSWRHHQRVRRCFWR